MSPTQNRTTAAGSTGNLSDFLVIGGGIAGVSVGYELAAAGGVAVLEQESAPGYHTTGRSAAVTSENYGAPGWRALTAASRSFLTDPPAGFAPHPLVTPRGALFVAGAAEADALRAEAAALRRRGVPVEMLTTPRIAALCPALRLDGIALGLHEPGCHDIDVDGLLQGFIRGLRRRGGRFVASAGVTALARRGGLWTARSAAGEFRAPILVNAAGAWADAVAALAGLAPLGIVPHRRTALTFDPPPGVATRRWPMVFDAAETYYFKPEAGRVMVSPVDLTPAAPGDCQPEELDVAVAVDRIERATTLRVGRIAHRWAGLRSFAADHEPVIGRDAREPSFVWLAGQGGNGVMASPAAARLAAALACGRAIPEALAAEGLSLAQVSPARLAAGRSSKEPSPCD